jgi:hypothetical protein
MERPPRLGVPYSTIWSIAPYAVLRCNLIDQQIDLAAMPEIASRRIPTHPATAPVYRVE